MASCTYILNDFLDRDSDRKHPIKKRRPLASHQLNTKQCAILLIFLFLLFIFGLFQISGQGIIWICCYLFLTLSYSFFLKKILVIDLITLSFLYLIRINGGFSLIDGVAAPSALMLGSFLFFFGLASLKRIIEIKAILDSGEKIAKVKAYNQDHLVYLNYFFYISLVLIFLYSSVSFFNQDTFGIVDGTPILVLLLFLWVLRLIYIKEKTKISSLLTSVLKDKYFVFLYFLFIVFFFTRQA